MKVARGLKFLWFFRKKTGFCDSFQFGARYTKLVRLLTLTELTGNCVCLHRSSACNAFVGAVHTELGPLFWLFHSISDSLWSSCCIFYSSIFPCASVDTVGYFKCSPFPGKMLFLHWGQGRIFMWAEGGSRSLPHFSRGDLIFCGNWRRKNGKREERNLNFLRKKPISIVMPQVTRRGPLSSAHHSALMKRQLCHKVPRGFSRGGSTSPSGQVAAWEAHTCTSVHLWNKCVSSTAFTSSEPVRALILTWCVSNGTTVEQCSLHPFPELNPPCLPTPSSPWGHVAVPRP